MENSDLLYMRIKKYILDEVSKLPPNERILSRNQLIKKYKVTRTTIDKSISELIGEGYLYSRDGSGTYVKDRTLKNLELKENETINWCIILPNIMKDTYPGILRGIEDVANDNNINVFICNTDNDIKKQANYIYKNIDSSVRGFIIVPAISNENDIAPFSMLEKKKIPFIFCNRGVIGIDAPMVTSNNFYGAYIATKHLISNGYRNIAYVSGPIYSIPIERYQGYTSAIGEAGLKINEEFVIYEETFDTDKPGYYSTKKLLSQDVLPDAIFCFNDIVAKGAYEAITEAGFKVGQDIGLAGYDNTYICESLPKKLTSVKFKTYETGVKAAETLLKMMKGETLIHNNITVLQPELIIRESSKKIINL